MFNTLKAMGYTNKRYVHPNVYLQDVMYKKERWGSLTEGEALKLEEQYAWALAIVEA